MMEASKTHHDVDQPFSRRRNRDLADRVVLNEQFRSKEVSGNLCLLG